MTDPTILAIDTSCDETSIAISKGLKTLSNIVASQIEFHKEFGGVVPHLAKRKHQEFLEPTYQKALKQAKITEQDITHIAVTIGPGLAPALETGIAFAKRLANKLNKPIIPINHMEGHLLSPFTQNRNGKAPLHKETAPFPLIALLISGGHTQIVFTQQIGRYTVLGETLDDAIGEAFDKASKMLNLGYPGGPIIEILARQGKPIHNLPIPLHSKPEIAFSYSGLKTALLYKTQQHPPQTKQDMCNYASSFQYSATKHLTQKLDLAIKQTNPKPKGIIIAGGAGANIYIRQNIRKLAKRHNIPVFIPYTKKLFGDNAAMIATAAYFKITDPTYTPPNPQSLDRVPNLSLKIKIADLYHVHNTAT